MIINYVIIILFPYTLKLLYMNTYEFPIVNYIYFQHNLQIIISFYEIKFTKFTISFTLIVFLNFKNPCLSFSNLFTVIFSFF